MRVLSQMVIRYVCFLCVVVYVLLCGVLNVIYQDKDVSSSERVILKNTKVYILLLYCVRFQHVLCCRMDGKLRKEVHQPMIALVPRVLRYVMVMVKCCIYSVVGWCRS